MRRPVLVLAVAWALGWGPALGADRAVWPDYQIIMWHDRTDQQYEELKSLGVSAGLIFADKPDLAQTGTTERMVRLNRHGLRWYVENIATDFYSAYHRWRPDQEVNAAFQEAKARHRADPDSLAPFKRDPSLSDPVWQRRIRDRLTWVVRQQTANRPLYYCLGDETGIADLAAYWDFDFSDESLRAFRVWLKERYGTLEALNRQWDRQFPRWSAVMPLTARQAIRADGDNYSAWADFREWMDIAFAHALRLGTGAVHAADRRALSGIEGGQVAGWGGYDYARLAPAIDVLETSGVNADMARSFNRRLVTLTSTSPSRSWPVERYRIWHEALHGSRGIILWDPDSAFVAKDGTIARRGREAAPVYTRLRGGLGALLINSEADPARVAIHYSQASQRVRWILDRKADGLDGIERETDADRPDSAFSQRRALYTRWIEDAGGQYRFLSSAQLAAGDLHADRVPILVLPDSVALSEAEIDAIRRYIDLGGVVIADGEPGLFDEHGRRRAPPPLADGGDPAPAGRSRIVRVGTDDEETRKTLRPLFATLGAVRGFAVTDDRGAPVQGVERHRFHNGGIVLLALLDADPARDRPRPLVVTLPKAAYVYDLADGGILGRGRRFAVTLAPDRPVLLAVAAQALLPPALSVTRPSAADDAATVCINSAPLAARPVFHAAVRDPAGTERPALGRTLIGRGATFRLTPDAGAPPGRWTVRITDRTSGQARDVAVDFPPRPR